MRIDKKIPTDANTGRAKRGCQTAGGRQLRKHLGGVLVGSAQVGPIDIRAQFFAFNDSTGGALNGRAMVCRNIPACQPVINDLRHNTDGLCQIALASSVGNCFLKCVHVDNHKHVGNDRQQVVFEFINNRFKFTP